MALSANQVWEVRQATGSDSNGGGFNPAASGTDYSQQASAQVAYTDLVIDGTTNTKVTSAANPFNATHVGNVINITGGTGFTVQRCEVVSVVGVTATLDKSAGTLASTGGTGNLGGALATLATAMGVAVAHNIVWGTGTFAPSGATLTVPQFVTLMGYASSRGDNGRLTFSGANQNAATNAISLTQPSRAVHVGVTSAKSAGIASTGLSYATDCIVTGAVGIGFSGIICVGCEATGCGSTGFSGGSWIGCYSAGNTIGFSLTTTTASAFRCVARANSSHGFAHNSFEGGVFGGCVAHSNSGNGFDLSSGVAILAGCVAYGNTGVGYNLQSGAGTHAGILNCYGGSNSSNVTNPLSVPDGGTVTSLTAQPFVDPTTTFDFTANTAAGGGAPLRAAGYPQSIPGLAGTSYPDAGAIQHHDAGGTTITTFIEG